MRENAIWILESCGPWGKSYVCSNCRLRSVSEINEFFTDNGEYDTKAEAKKLLEDYPYCHCGAKMSVDKEVSRKLKEFRKKRKAGWSAMNWYHEIYEG